jgi:YD repeat-containing protein
VNKPTRHAYTALYEANGRRTTLQLGLGSTRQYAYDAADRLTTQIELNASLQPIVTLIDTYDNAYNRLSRTTNGELTSWTYDRDYRLVLQLGAIGTATFIYDSLGNVLTKWHMGQAPISMSYDAASRLVTGVQGVDLTSYVYDNAGNLRFENAVASGGITTNIYNGANREVNIQYPTGAISSYSYSGDGLRRQLQDTGAPVTFTVWDGSDYLQERS